MTIVALFGLLLVACLPSLVGNVAEARIRKVKPISQINLPDARFMLASKSGEVVFAQGNSKVDRLDPGTLKTIASLAQSNDRVVQMSLSSDGARACVVTEDGAARVSDIRTGRQLALVDLGRPVLHQREPTAVLSPSGHYLSTIAADGTWSERDVVTHQVIWRYPLPESSSGGWLGYSPDGKWLAASGFDSDGILGQSLLRRPDRQVEVPNGMHGPAEFSPNSEYVTFCDHQHDGVLRALRAGAATRFHSDRRLVTATPDDAGHLILATEGDDWKTARLEMRGKDGISELKVESGSGPLLTIWTWNGYLVVADGDGGLFIMDGSNGHRMANLEGHHEPVQSFVVLGEEAITLDIKGNALRWKWPTF